MFSVASISLIRNSGIVIVAFIELNAYRCRKLNFFFCKFLFFVFRFIVSSWLKHWPSILLAIEISRAQGAFDQKVNNVWSSTNIYVSKRKMKGTLYKEFSYSVIVQRLEFSFQFFFAIESKIWFDCRNRNIDEILVYTFQLDSSKIHSCAQIYYQIMGNHW